MAVRVAEATAGVAGSDMGVELVDTGLCSGDTGEGSLGEIDVCVSDTKGGAELLTDAECGATCAGIEVRGAAPGGGGLRVFASVDTNFHLATTAFPITEGGRKTLPLEVYCLPHTP